MSPLLCPIIAKVLRLASGNCTTHATELYYRAANAWSSKP